MHSLAAALGFGTIAMYHRVNIPQHRNCLGSHDVVHIFNAVGRKTTPPCFIHRLYRELIGVVLAARHRRINPSYTDDHSWLIDSTTTDPMHLSSFAVDCGRACAIGTTSGWRYFSAMHTFPHDGISYASVTPILSACVANADDGNIYENQPHCTDTKLGRCVSERS